MKRNDIKQLVNADAKELQAKVEEARVKLRTLRFDKAVGKVKNAHEITLLRKDIARLLTAVNQQRTKK